MPTFRIIDNPDPDQYPGHQCIEVVEDDGRVSSRSWAEDTVPIEARLNLDHPQAEDRRSIAPPGQTVGWAMPTAAVCDLLGIDVDHLDAAARSRGLDTSKRVDRRDGVPPGEPSPRT